MLGISCDSQHSHRVYSNGLGNIPYPLLADYYPQGEMTKAYDLWNEERGTPNRSVVIVDKDGIIRYRKLYPSRDLPDPEEILAEVAKLG